MTQNVYDTLIERGFLAQTTHADIIRRKLGEEKVVFYTGFDPTADSLHVGHMIALMMMAHLQRAGHKPIALVGGGTAMIGDPSGRSDLRQMMTPETIAHNASCFQRQMSLIIDFADSSDQAGNGAILVNNADWLGNLDYLSFIRDIGVHFSVNRMLTAECYKQRLERGLTFLEFNYMLLQAYDYLQLFRNYGCTLQMGGDDQWSNVLAGVDLVRRVEQSEVYGATVKLLLNSEGGKMGKTAKGAVWLDENKMPVFDFYQYWRNLPDSDIINCLKLLTFVEMSEIEEYARLEGSDINQAKLRLAYEVTKIVHGQEKAQAAERQAKELFSGGGRSKDMPTAEINSQQLPQHLLSLMADHKFVPSRSEGRRLLQQGGIYLNNQVVTELDRQLTAKDFHEGEAIIRRGKKNFYRLLLK